MLFNVCAVLAAQHFQRKGMSNMIQMVLKRIESDKRDVLANLWQLYESDFSPYTLTDVNEHGLYECEIPDEYWVGNEEYSAYFIEVNDQIAGFVMVSVGTDIG